MDLIVDAAVVTANSVVHNWLTSYFTAKEKDSSALAPMIKPRVDDVLQIMIFMVMGYVVL